MPYFFSSSQTNERIRQVEDNYDLTKREGGLEWRGISVTRTHKGASGPHMIAVKIRGVPTSQKS